MKKNKRLIYVERDYNKDQLKIEFQSLFASLTGNIGTLTTPCLLDNFFKC